MILGALVVVVVGILLVRYFRNLSTQPLPTTGVPAEQKMSIGKYIVKKGDNLWKIAEMQFGSGYNWVDIANENGISNPNLIEEGQELVIPDVQAKQLTVQEVEEDITSQETFSEATYTVAQGDNLWNIALKAYGDGYKWVEIARENNLANPDLIHPGNIFILPR